MTDDTELLRKYAADHSETAFAELVRRHVDLVYSVALRKVGGDAHSAGDVAQSVFLALARRAASLTERRALAGWLYLTTHHLAAQTVRSARRRQTREQLAHSMNELFDQPDINWHQLRPVLDEALQALSEPDREAVLLRYFEQRPFAEIGSALHVTEAAARMRVDRALEKLRALLARRGVSSTAAALATVLGSQVTAAPAGLATTITGAVVAGVTSAAGTTAASAGIFMTTTNLITGTVALAAIGAALYLSNEVSHRAADLDAAHQQRDALQSRLEDVESRLAQASRHSAELADQITAIRSNIQPTPPVKAATVAGPTVAEAARLTEEHQAKVSAENRQAEIQRALAGYDPLFKKLELSPSQVDAFRALLTASLGRHADLRAAAQTTGVRATDPDILALNSQTDADLASGIRSTFGEATLSAYQHFNDTGAMRELTSVLTAALATTATPLSPTQADQLIEILASHSRTPDGKFSGDPRALNLDAALAEAQALLSPPQLAALRQAYNDRR